MYKLMAVFKLQLQMKRSSNTRKKLVLNHTKKASPPPKLQVLRLNELKITSLHSTAGNTDSNGLKQINSSIYGKENEGTLLLRCRSISCVDKERIQSRNNPSLNKLYSNNQTIEKLKSTCPEVNLAAMDFAVVLKQRGFLSNLTKVYSIPKDALTDLIVEFGEKIRQQLQKNTAVHSDDTFSSKHGSLLHLATRHSQNLLIDKQFELTLGGFSRQLSLKEAVINLKIQGESLQQKKVFKQILQTLSLSPDQQSLTFLCDKLKYLQQEVEHRTTIIRQLSQQAEALTAKKVQIQLALAQMEKRLIEKKMVLINLEQQVKDIEDFVYKQPNKILKKQAEGFKQSQQQLFDLACIMDQSAINSIQTYVNESILIQSQSFKFTLNTLASRQFNYEGNIFISKQQIEAFRNSINVAYDSTISKLKSIIEAKSNKIRNFVGIMRRLASYTIGKRQYLNQINKKMASASLNAQELLKNLRKAVPAQTDKIDGIQELFECVKSIYCEAQVFY